MNLRPDTFALLLNIANVNANSRVLLVEKTKGFITGALLEKGVAEILNLELSHFQIKLTTEILLEYDLHPYLQRKVTYLH